MRKTRAQHGRRKGGWAGGRIGWAAGAAALFALGVGGVDAPGSQKDDLLSMVSRLPAGVERVLAVEGLSRHRATATGKCIERFVEEIGLLERTGPAWSQLAWAMDYEPGRAADELLGERAVLVFAADRAGVVEAKGENGGAAGSGYALLSTITPAMDWRLRRALKPAPRKLEDGLSVLSLEDGAFELTTAPIRDGGDSKTVMLLAPRTEPELFDSMLPFVAGREVAAPLGKAPCWHRVERLGKADVVFLMREPRAEHENADAKVPASDPYFAIAGVVHENRVTGEFSGTPGVLVNEPLRPPAGSVWPAKTIERLEQGAALLSAGVFTPIGQGDRPKAGFGGNLLESLIALLRLPESLRREFDGVGVVAVRAAGNEKGEGVSVTAVIHVRDLRKFAGITDTWIGEAVNAKLDPETGLLGGVGQTRMLDYQAAKMLGVFLGGNGVLTWEYVPIAPPIPSEEMAEADAPKHEAAWWIININTNPARGGEEANEIKSLRRLVESEAKAAPDDPVLRLLVQPERVRQILKARMPAPALAAAEGAASARGLAGLRWIESISSTVRIDGDGLYRGSMEAVMNTGLLKEEEGESK